MSMLRRTLQVVGVRVDATKASKVAKKLHAHLLNVPKLRNVVPDPTDEGMKLVLLSASAETLQPLRETLAVFLRAGSFSFVPHSVQIDFNEYAKESVVEKGRGAANKAEHRVIQTLPIGDVSFRPVGDDNVEQLHEINEELFPVKYGNAFYEYVADAPEGYCKLAYSDDDTAIGAVCCEVEMVKISGKLPLSSVHPDAWRNGGASPLQISVLLESVIAQARKDGLAYVYLHVQCSNTAAQRFYFAHGFECVKLKRNYYSQLNPPHGFVLRKQLALAIGHQFVNPFYRRAAPISKCYIMSMPLLDKKLFKKTLEVVGVRVEAKKIGRVVKRLHWPPAEPAAAAQRGAGPDQPRIRTRIPADYSYFAVDQVLSELLPKGMDIPSSFETVGHIAHLNLRDNQLPYKNIIGQVILDKNAQIRTVVNKTDNIETKFRTFPMEVLAGDDDMEVEVHESKATFRFNYAEVYWNSRLQQEHLRVIRSIKPHDVVCDMMCGIGPFAIPVALNGSKVYANDLNPRSYHYLKENITVNQVEKLVTPYNLDGREFLAKLLGEKKQFTQVLMNLPAIALEFLDAFPGQFDHWEGELPYIHCYCFSNADDVKKDVKERAEKIMGGELDLARTSLHLVRDVAPKKVMVCISFQLPESIAFSAERRASKQDDPKRRKVEADAAA
ncbi:hypothetical protein PRNP1_002700 [Phytophthora ramorum]